MMNEQDEIRKILYKAGADKVGFADASSYFSEYTTALLIATSTKRIYELGRHDTLNALNELMDCLGTMARQWLAERGHGYSGLLFSQEEKSYAMFAPHRELAIIARLGVRGKNGLVICAEYGPRIQTTVVLTTMPFLREEGRLQFNPCKGCNVCVEICPTGAIGGRFEREKCVLCFKCVIHCPAGEDFEEAKRYASITENIWGF